MSADEFARLVVRLCALPREAEWVEFKHNDALSPDGVEAGNDNQRKEVRGLGYARCLRVDRDCGCTMV